nr:hypothetical protein [Sphingomonas sp. Y57]
MGKVLKIVAAVAVTAAVAWAAPALGGAFLSAIGVSASTAIGAGLTAGALATSIAATTLTLTAAYIMRALAPGPTTSPAGWGMDHSQAVPRSMGAIGWIEEVPAISGLHFGPVRDRWWRDPYPRGLARDVTIDRYEGNCMVPRVAQGPGYVVVDRKAPISAGDLFIFRPDDLATHYFRGAGWFRRFKSAAIVKELVGVDEAGGQLVYRCSNPAATMTTGLRRVRWAYRVVATAPTWLAACRAASACRAL